jgi:hypothetical protein
MEKKMHTDPGANEKTKNSISEDEERKRGEEKEAVFGECVKIVEKEDGRKNWAKKRKQPPTNID